MPAAPDMVDGEALLEHDDEPAASASSARRNALAVSSLVAVLGLVMLFATALGRPNAVSVYGFVSKAESTCVQNGQNCMESKCCSDEGMTCYVKNQHWASCNATCNEKMKWNKDTNQFEEQAEKVWLCQELGKNEPKQCSNNGENCQETGCCNGIGQKCFVKNEHWWSCNETCNTKMMWNVETNQFEEQDKNVWDCAEQTEPMPEPVACTMNGENCHESKCCSEDGMKCFVKNEHWASCNSTCNEKMMWNDDTGRFEEQAEAVWSCTELSK